MGGVDFVHAVCAGGAAMAASKERPYQKSAGDKVLGDRLDNNGGVFASEYKSFRAGSAY